MILEFIAVFIAGGAAGVILMAVLSANGRDD